MNRRPLKKTSEIEYMVEDGESKTDSGEAPTDEERNGSGKGPRGEKEQDATVSEYEKKRWKEDVREKRR